jgi:hypothetical protein
VQNIHWPALRTLVPISRIARGEGVGIFYKNLVLLRAEARVAVGVGAPPAFAIADLTA